MNLPRFLSSGNLMTGLQVGGAVLGTVATVSATKTILGDVKEIAPFALAGVAIIGTIYLVTKI